MLTEEDSYAARNLFVMKWIPKVEAAAEIFGRLLVVHK